MTLSGVLQLVFAALRLGSLVSYVPLPVVAGFMDGVAALIIVSQVRVLIGAASLGVLVVTAATAAVAWIVARRAPRLPWALVAIACGTGLHWLLSTAMSQPGPLLGAPAPGLSIPLLSLSQSGMTALDAHARGLVTTAIVIAVIGSLETLLAAAGIDARLHTRHVPNRLLFGQGLGNIAVGILGGIPNVTSISVQIAAHRAGARGRSSGVLCSALLLIAMLLGRSVIALVPLAATVGVMLVVSLSMFDQWSRTVWRQVRDGQRNRDAMWSLATVAIVCVVTVIFGFVTGLAVGVGLSVVLFVAAQNRSLVRSVSTAKTRASRRIYVAEHARILRERGGMVRIVEVESAIFFGTAHRLERKLEKLAEGVRFLVVDISRVTMIDASGAHAFERLAGRVRAMGTELLLSGLTLGDRHARTLHAHGALVTGETAFYPDIDRALEHAERQVLEAAGTRAPDAELPIEALALLKDMDASQVGTLVAHLSRRELAAKEVLFRQGEPGDCVYALAKGSITMLAPDARRLATFTPGVVFGEAAMIDGGGRTATGVADETSIVYVLTRDALESIRTRDAGLAHLVMINIARQLSARLRFANAMLAAER